MNRLESYIEGNGLMDEEQEGFRKQHSTVNAVLRLVQSIFNGFENNKCTAAIFVDLKGAFDNIWREGLVVKLHEIGVQGKLLKWINNFLQNRSAKCTLDQTSGPTFETTLGLPQGSVLSPILFNTYIIDMYRQALLEHCKFADDGTVWVEETLAQEAVMQCCAGFKRVKLWCQQRRLTVSLTKTEASLFTKLKLLAAKPIFDLDGTELKYNATPKILGFTLDEQLTFEEHMKTVARKASNALKIIREVKGIAAVSTSKLIRLYTSLVRSIMEYGAMVWQCSKYCTKLASIQRKALCLCLGLPSSAATDAVEVAAGILPLDLHFTQIAIKEVAKIQAKPINRPIKCQLNRMTEEEIGHDTQRYTISPLRLALTQAEEMRKLTGIDIRVMEQEFEFEKDCLLMSSKTPVYWSRLGSSKSRTAEQKELGKEMVLDLMMEAPEGTTFAFTDGSCLTNPGPCGAGAVVYPCDQDPVRLKRPVCKRGSILLGELVAILTAIEYLIQNISSIPCKLLKVFCDSQSAVGILTLGWKDTSYKDVVSDAKKGIDILEQKGIPVQIDWTPGHSSIAGNEIADHLAKEAAKEAETFTDDRKFTSIAEVKMASKKYVTTLWQNRWDNSDTGRTFHGYFPKVDAPRMFDIPTKRAYSHILQLQTGYSQLNEYRHKLGQTKTNQCTCGQVETTEHYLTECTLYEQQRNLMAMALGRNIGLYHTDTYLLLNHNEEDEHTKGQTETIRRELATYIEATGRFGPASTTPPSP